MKPTRSILGLLVVSLFAQSGCLGESVGGGGGDARVDVTADVAVSCPTPLRACVGGCADTRTDRAHCGACGVACGATEAIHFTVL